MSIIILNTNNTQRKFFTLTTSRCVKVELCLRGAEGGFQGAGKMADIASQGHSVKLRFLGTKGEIEEFTDRHQYNASLLLEYGGTRLLIDYGKLRKYTLQELKPDYILITHAHPDPYAWLYEDIKTDIPVYLTQETYDYGKYRPANPRIIKPGEEFDNGPFHWTDYRVMHSIRCPAVGFKLWVAENLWSITPTWWILSRRRKSYRNGLLYRRRFGGTGQPRAEKGRYIFRPRQNEYPDKLVQEIRYWQYHLHPSRQRNAHQRSRIPAGAS